MSRRQSVRALARALTSSSHHFCTSAESSTQFPMKHVTRSNFESSLEDLRRHVKASDFVSIDLEMTGLTSAPWRDSYEFDRFDVRFLKVKDSAENFAVLQFGVCPFRWDPEKQSLVANPYNFYIFPRQETAGGGWSSGFMCQTSSLDFLARHQFDFNACIKEGISYLSREQEDEARKRLELEFDRRYTGLKEEPLVRVADVLFTHRMKNKFKAWRETLLQIKSRDSSVNCSQKELNQQFETIFYKMRPSLVLSGFTFYQLRLIQLVLSQHFDELVYVCVSTTNSSPQHLVVYTESQNDKDLLLKEYKDDPLSESKKKIKSGVGFRHVIDLLSSEHKLIVGHNCFLDFAHIYSKFIGPLPSTAEEFVSGVHSCFPYVIDTKRLLSADGYLQYLMKKSSTSLSKAFAVFCPQDAAELKYFSSSIKTRVKVEVQVDEFSSSSWDSGAKHEAGYDAFMTGCIFAQACSHLGFDFTTHSSSTCMADSEYLQRHINLLYLSWKSGDIINLRTQEKITESSVSSSKHTRKYPALVYPNMLLIWGFPRTLKASDIKQSICKAFGATSVTSIYDLDGSAVFVQFSKAELVSEFMNMKEKLERKNDIISVLHPLSTLLDGGKTQCAGYEVYKEICSQPMSCIRFADQAEALSRNWTSKSTASSAGGDSEMENSLLATADEGEPGSGIFLTDQWMKSYQLSLEEDRKTEADACNPCEIIQNS
uniref:Uncharacterized protein n=1 Tax=Kalanchoe fedtschenkoi TaxID=63787 RepID=A0A7N0U321_KALFE